jgi:ketosteroid isomerase-like protein
MNDPIQSPGRRFYDDQIALLQQGRTDELVETHYHPDAVLVSFENVVRGHAALRDFFRQYCVRLGDFKVLSLDQFVETGDALFFEATVSSAFGKVQVYDAFSLRAGRATHHFAGRKST